MNNSPVETIGAWFTQQASVFPMTKRVFGLESQDGEPAPWGERDPWGHLGYRWPIWDGSEDVYLLVVNPEQLWVAAKDFIHAPEWQTYLEAVQTRQFLATFFGLPEYEDPRTLPPVADAYLQATKPLYWGLLERVELAHKFKDVL